MRYLDFPSQDEWTKLFEVSPFEKFRSYVKVLDEKNRTEARPGAFGFAKRVEIIELTGQLAQRLDDVITSYVMLTYYYSKGIPDKKWYASPGEDGESIQYYPDFDKQHFYIKEWFDYYSDIFYYKLFSAWDLVGHILNARYELKIEEKGKRVGFHSAVNALSQKEESLYSQLEKIRNHSEFEKANGIRNNITHNYSPSSTGLAVNMTEKGGSVGIRGYITSDEIMSNIRAISELFEKTLTHISS